MDLQPGLLADLSHRRLLDRLPAVHVARREGPPAEGRFYSPAYQDQFAVHRDQDDYRELGVEKYDVPTVGTGRSDLVVDSLVVKPGTASVTEPEVLGHMAPLGQMPAIVAARISVVHGRPARKLTTCVAAHIIGGPPKQTRPGIVFPVADNRNKEPTLAELRKNRVKHKLEQGEVASVVSGQNTANMIEVLGNLGFDGAWIETEHGPFDFADIPDLSRSCDLWGMTSVVRVNLNFPGVIYRTLDVGAQGIVVPHVDTVEDARSVVHAGRFAPQGLRGNYTSRQGIGVDDYATKANDEVLLVVLIEDIKAIENLAEILTVDHIDVFFVAPGDLSQSMGRLGGMNDPEVQRVVDGAYEQIIGAGKVAGGMAGDDAVESVIEKGVRFLLTGWEPWLSAGAKTYLDKIESASR